MKRTLLRTVPAVLCLSFTSALAQQTISTPILTSVPNFRDVAGISAANGGTGFADTTSNNGVLRTGVFYRAQQLTLSGPDLATISRLHIGLDIDLRTPSEIAAAPDVVPIGARYVNVNIYGTAATPPEPLINAATSIADFKNGYRAFVTNPTERAGFHSVLIDLANEANSALFHCSGGKDRTGWTAALLQSIAGVSPATIMNDYLATNRYTATFISTELAAVRATQGDQAAAAAAPILGVLPDFLQAGLDQMIASYGSLNGYLINGLGLTQADIYVLRGKLVDYLTLPGQAGFVGNAAAGAMLLNQLQNSPLSGHYTAYNYYLQSAVDAGTLGGVQAQVGGQVHADAAASLLHQPVWIDAAIAPYTSGRDLGVGQTRIWLTGIGGYFNSAGHAGVVSSTGVSAGEVVGATYRINDQASVYAGIGGDWSSVGSAGATVNVTTGFATFGGRYGFSTLAAGPYVAAHANVGLVDYQSRRPLGGGLGTPKGQTTGTDYSVRADLGDVIPLAPFTVTPQLGVRVSHVSLRGFNETGSEVALAVNDIGHTLTSLIADLDVGLDPRHLGDWTILPTATLGYEVALNSSQVASSGRLYGFTVSQRSADDSRYLVKAGLGVTALHDAFTVKAAVNTVLGDRGAGVNGQLSVAYSF